MFKHGRNSEFVCYSVNEKIKYYTKMLSSKSPRDRERAETRLVQLNGLKARTFVEPDLIVTNDTHFGQKMSKPRLCAVIDADSKGRVYVAPIVHRTSKAIILDNDHDRQLGDKRAWVDRSEIYETKYIDGVQPLTRNDKEKIKKILRKK